MFETVYILGEIEGHDGGSSDKNTKYDEIIPRLVSIENNDDVEGVLFVINTMGGDVSAGLALAEMIAGLSKPTVSLVIGESHSIGVPIAVAANYSFIVKSATVVIHPVRMTGTILGTRQTYRQFRSIQDRIVRFISEHSRCGEESIEKMMMDTSMMSSDLGTILVGEEAVEAGLIDENGSIDKAWNKLKFICQNKGEMV
ncbi:aTP-dependent Clp protease proteolytic subunit [Eshraghiella crossota CAG:259]|uniref:ATP-dependent Clp protease proteolytic subunit n=1 Tax=Eshraghiella crossota CAG:259 TaxID=1263062 RepID=R5LEC3_9FIRM|nr:aTP-dependent Clp protease proteolytic subunit [Butyrivibrio crossotus CAG:259]